MGERPTLDRPNLDVLVYCLIGGLMVAVPTACIAYVGFALVRKVLP